MESIIRQLSRYEFQIKDFESSFKIRAYGITLSLLLLIIISCTFVPRTDGSEVVERIVAKVDNEIILLSDLKQKVQLEMLQRKIDPTKNPEIASALEREVLEGMLADMILLVKAKSDSVQVSQEEIESALKNEIEQLKTQAGSEGEFQKQLSQAGLTEKDLRDKYRKEIRNYLLRQRVVASLSQKISVSYNEVVAFYNTYKDSIPPKPERVNISHIMLISTLSSESKAKARQKAEEVLALAKKGGDFAELAKRYSEDPGSAKNGGDLGYFEKGTMVPPFERAAFVLNPGQVSDIVETDFGYHIIKVEEKTDKGVKARHILIMLKPSEEDMLKTVQKLNTIRQKALSGEDFSKLVQEYSEDNKTVSQGGLLGWFDFDELPPNFKPFVKKLEPGEISSVVQSNIGYHIIRLNDRQVGGKVTLENDRQLLEDMVRQQKIKKTFDEMIAKEKEKIYIDIRL